MKKIKLTQGQVALVDDALFPILNQHKWYASKGGKTFYARRNIRKRNGKQTSIGMHRYIFELLGLSLPRIIDHKSRNGLDNRVRNLRPATNSQQSCNHGKRCDNISGFVGVSFDEESGKWRATATINGKMHYLGRFDDPKQAARVRDKFVKQHHGEFAFLNRARDALARIICRAA